MGLDSALMDRYFPALENVKTGNLNFIINDTQITEARYALSKDDTKEQIQRDEDLKTLDQLKLLYDQSKAKKAEKNQKQTGTD